MAINVVSVTKHLRRKGIRFGLSKDDFGAVWSFRTDSWVPGGPPLDIVIRALESGRVLRVEIPMGYSLSATSHRAAVIQALMKVQGDCRLVRYDLIDGEILPNADLMLEDSESTSGQFDMFMTMAINGVCRHDQVIRRAMDSGVVSLDHVDPAGTAGPEC